MIAALLPKKLKDSSRARRQIQIDMNDQSEQSETLLQKSTSWEIVFRSHPSVNGRFWALCAH